MTFKNYLKERTLGVNAIEGIDWDEVKTNAGKVKKTNLEYEDVEDLILPFIKDPDDVATALNQKEVVKKLADIFKKLGKKCDAEDWIRVQK
jgi:hypothetical protein